VPSHYGLHSLRAIIPSGEHVILIYGGRYLAVLRGQSVERVFDLGALRDPPKADPQWKEFTSQDATYAQVVGVMPHDVEQVRTLCGSHCNRYIASGVCAGGSWCHDQIADVVLTPGRLRALAEVADEATQRRSAAPSALGLEHIPDEFAVVAEAVDECSFVAGVQTPGVAGRELVDFQPVAAAEFGGHWPKLLRLRLQVTA
jgi:hypothetical protein